MLQLISQFQWRWQFHSTLGHTLRLTCLLGQWFCSFGKGSQSGQMCMHQLWPQAWFVGMAFGVSPQPFSHWPKSTHHFAWCLSRQQTLLVVDSFGMVQSCLHIFLGLWDIRDHQSSTHVHWYRNLQTPHHQNCLLKGYIFLIRLHELSLLLQDEVLYSLDAIFLVQMLTMYIEDLAALTNFLDHMKCCIVAHIGMKGALCSMSQFQIKDSYKVSSSGRVGTEVTIVCFHVSSWFQSVSFADILKSNDETNPKY